MCGANETRQITERTERARILFITFIGARLPASYRQTAQPWREPTGKVRCHGRVAKASQARPTFPRRPGTLPDRIATLVKRRSSSSADKNLGAFLPLTTELLRELFGACIASGSVDAIVRRTAAALEQP
jgi:hypothetical protein